MAPETQPQYYDTPEAPDTLGKLEDPLKKDKPEDQKQSENTEGLTPQEVKDLDEGKTTFAKLRDKRLQTQKDSHEELDYLLKEDIISLKEKKEIQDQINNEKSPEKLGKMLDDIRDIPSKKERTKEEAKERAKEEEKVRDPESTEIKSFEKKWTATCKLNRKLIGDKQMSEGGSDSFTSYFAKAIRENPTIKHAKELLAKLEGTETKHKDGLFPRREEYEKLTALFRRWKLGDPYENSDYIRQNGLSERQEYRANAQELEGMLRIANPELYSQDFKEDLMEDILTKDSPAEQRKFILQVKEMQREEATGHSHLNDTIEIEGKRINKMARKEKAESLRAYREDAYFRKVETRIDSAKRWKGFVDASGDLAKDLRDVYIDKSKGRDDKEGLHLALDAFEEEDFQEREKSVKKHEKDVDKAESQEKHHKQLIIDAVEKKSGEAVRKKILAKKTADKFKEYFEEDGNFKDPHTGKKGDLKTMKKHFEIFKSDTPDGKAQNLKAYEVKRARFAEELKELRTYQPDITDDEINKWQERYDSEGWTKRKAIYKEMHNEVEESKKEYMARKLLEKEMGLDEQKPANEDREVAENADEAIRQALALSKEKQYEEAIRTLLDYLQTDLGNEDVTEMISLIQGKMNKEGGGKQLEDDQISQAEEEVDTLIDSDETTGDAVEELNLHTLNIIGTKQSEDQEKVIDLHDRARKRVLDRASDETDRELKEQYIDQTDDDHVIDEEKDTGAEVISIDFTEKSEYSQSEKEEIKQRTKEKQSNLTQRKGFTHARLEKDGKQMTSEQAQSQRQRDLQKLATETTEQAVENAERKTGKVFDLAARKAAEERAKKRLEEESTSTERLRNAA